jgi:outer membrane receptor protein involved in Fe transport
MRAIETGRFTALMAALVILMAASWAWGAVTGVVAGAVTDQETGAALSGANVSLVGTELSTVTDDRGRFVITNVPPGTYRVGVSLIGYTEAQVTDVVVVQGQTALVESALEPTVVEVAGAEAVVTAARVALRPDVTASVYVTTAAEEQLTLSQPNDRYQFPGLVFAQPGAVPDSTFYPHIRGARANQVGYFLDGIPITDPDANVFATNIVSIGLDRLELFTGGYPAEFGGFTGGIVNQVVKRGDQVRGGLVDVSAGSPYDFGGLILERGDVEDRLNWYYGVNSWHSALNENLFTSAVPTSSDHMAKVIYDAGDRDTVTLLAHHGYARYLMPWQRMFSFDPVAADWFTVRQDDDYARQGHNLDAVTLNHTVDPKAYWTLRLSRLQHFLDLELGDPDNLFWQHRNERMFTGQFDYERQVGDHRVRAGVWRINSDNDSTYSVLLFPAGFVSDNDTANTQAYLQDTWELGRRLTLTLGGRYEQMKYDRAGWGDLDLSENSARAGFTYKASPSVLLRGSWGQYVEFPRANLIAYEFSGTDYGWYSVMAPEFPFKPQIDQGRELGLEWKLDSSTLMTATWFQRDSDQMMQRWQGALHDETGAIIVDAYGNPVLSDALSDFDEMAPVWFASNGTGTARGTEVKVDRRMSNNLRGWIAYTYLDAKATSPRDNIYPYGYGFLNRTDAAGLAEEFPVDWNQTHTAALAFAYGVGKLTVNPWVTYGSGFPYGQSGLDLGGSDPAHVPNPDYDPDNPIGPAELVVPENYVDPNDPQQGFITPNALETGANLTVSLNLSYETQPNRQLYLQIYNLFDREDATSYVIGHPQTGGIIGRVENDQVYYVPFSRTPPRFFAFGVRQAF